MTSRSGELDTVHVARRCSKRDADPYQHGGHILMRCKARRPHQHRVLRTAARHPLLRTVITSDMPVPLARPRLTSLWTATR